MPDTTPSEIADLTPISANPATQAAPTMTPAAACARISRRVRVVRIGLNVGDVHRLPLEGSAC